MDLGTLFTLGNSGGSGEETADQTLTKRTTNVNIADMFASLSFSIPKSATRARSHSQLS
jgi:hypothetical protein